MNRLLALMVLMAWPLSAHGQVPDEPLPKGAVARLGTTRWRHGTGVSFLTYLPDGKLLTAGWSWDSSARVWDEKGTELRRFQVAAPKAPAEGFGARMRPVWSSPAVALSADGKLLAVCSWGDWVRFWDVESAKELEALNIGWETLPVEGLAISNDKKRVALSRTNGSTTIWDIAKGKKILTIGEPKSTDRDWQQVNLPRFVAGDSLLVTEIVDNSGPLPIRRIKALDVQSGKAVFDVPANLTSLICFSADGARMAFVVGRHDIVTVIDTSSGKIVQQLPALEDELVALAWSPDSRHLVTAQVHFAAAHPVTFRVWDVEKGKEVRRTNTKGVNAPSGSTYPPELLAMSPDGKKLAWAPAGQSVEIIEVESGRRATGEQSLHGVRGVSFLPDGKAIQTWHADFELRWWDKGTAKEAKPAAQGRGHLGCISPDGKWKVVEERTEVFKLKAFVLIDVEKGKAIGKIAPPGDKFAGFLRMAPNSRTLGVFEVGLNNHIAELHLYDLPTLKRRCVIPTAEHWIVAFSADGKRVLVYVGRQQLGVFDGGTGKLLAICTLAADTNKLFHGAFSPDNRMAAVDMDDGRLAVWETRTGAIRAVVGEKEPYNADERLPARGMPSDIFGYLRPLIGTCVEFSPDGSLLAWGRLDGSVEVWNVYGSKKIATLKGHQMRVNTVAFSPDGAYLASGSSDTTVVVWKTPKVGK